MENCRSTPIRRAWGHQLRILKTASFPTLFANEYQELNIHLKIMLRNLFLIAFCVKLAHPRAARKAVQAMAAKGA